MSKIQTRQDFVDQLGPRGIEAIKVVNEASLQRALYGAGLDASALLAADLDRDGWIRGPQELNRVFDVLDLTEYQAEPGWTQRLSDFVFGDRTSSRDSIALEGRLTGETKAGGLYRHLSALAEPMPDYDVLTRAATDTWQRLGLEGRRSIEARTFAHYDAIERTGVGAYYGDHSDYAKLSWERQRAWVKQHARPDSNPPMPKTSSCIGWVLENLGVAYRAAGLGPRWAEIQETMRLRNALGMELAKELQRDGWTVLYWTKDARHIPESGDALTLHTRDRDAAMPGDGRRGTYWGVTIDDVIVNYQPTTSAPEDQRTAQDLSGIERLREIPFFVGMAKRAIHTFVGRNGRVSENHWDQDPNSRAVIQETPLEQWAWTSGIILVPPGAWKR